ncbi:MAG: GvpL/GvpF family gas vesicle protein [Jatrophihabitans sp.]|uniref:GvpL/GvpF family gas vesicle protein n=1 Tax=Jatrophihabitans sp. TaxID=1932789 RepID=UPI0039146643
MRAHRHRPQDHRLTGVAAPMLLNAAFLVDRHRADQFRRAVDELAGVRAPDAIALTGPWPPPYSFAALEQQRPRSRNRGWLRRRRRWSTCSTN